MGQRCAKPRRRCDEWGGDPIDRGLTGMHHDPTPENQPGVAMLARTRPTLSILPAVAAATWLGCNGGGTSPNLADVSGRWNFVEQFSDPVQQASCADTGTYVITQTADGFVGGYFQRGVCRGSFGVVDNTDSGTVTEGHVVGQTVRFKAPNCDYDGKVATDDQDRLDGHVACAISDPTISYNFSGTWTAHR
jgi:hypothetical protein